jgi:hypothetical protein
VLLPLKPYCTIFVTLFISLVINAPAAGSPASPEEFCVLGAFLKPKPVEVVAAGIAVLVIIC